MRTLLLTLLAPSLALAAPDQTLLAERAARFAPVPITADLASLPPSERKALARLVEAARILDAVFLRQVWAGNPSLLLTLAADASPLGRARLHAFLLDKGPWSRLDRDAPFLDGIGDKPASAAFYPADATKPEIEAWMHALPEAAQKEARGFYTVIRRGSDGKLKAVPYSLEYQDALGLAAGKLREAAAATTSPSLRAFLGKRAAAFASNDYYDSDVAWMELDSAVEPTIGPYEVYEDGWFNAKAAFESFITVRDDAETKKLARLGAELQGLEDHLPVDKSLRNAKLGALAPIAVVNEIYASGDASHGVQTAAFNLPNDERIEKEKGTKRVMLRNVQQAKFDQVLVPIARVALSAADQKRVSFDAFFTHILMHELMHGLGPHVITADSKPSTVRAELQDCYSALEEAKADVSGLWALQRLVDGGKLEASLGKTMYLTFLASSFRSIRFGLTEAHGKGVALQINWMLDHGGFVVAPDGTFTVDDQKIRAAVESLTTEILTTQAHGDRAHAKKLLESMAVLRPEVKRVLDKLGAVPVDIEPRFTTADTLSSP